VSLKTILRKDEQFWSEEYTMSTTGDRILSDFGKSTMALAQRLEEEPDFGLIEQVFIENHIHILQSAYGSWKRRRVSKASGGST
jgi:hypothetical protein